jgi:transposase InsO family protein
VLDDHSRIAYAEIHDDKTAATAIGVLRRAVSRFAARGVQVHRVISDNGGAYTSHACHDLGIKAKETRPYRPQTNGKIERFHRTWPAGPSTASTSPKPPEPPCQHRYTTTSTTAPTHRHRQSHPHQPPNHPP